MIVRCNNNKPTPYLRKIINQISLNTDDLIYDLGCGNLRNTKFLHSRGFHNVVPLDLGGDYGAFVDITKGIPAKDNSVSLALCNYIFCFLNKRDCDRLAREINRIGNKYLIVELYPARQGHRYSSEQILKLFPKWEVIHKTKYRFLIRK